MRRALLIALSAVVVALVGPLPSGVAAQGHAKAAKTTTVTLFHGIPNTPVDVYVNGARLLDDFQPGTFAGPLTIPAGKYKIAVTAASATDASHPILGPVKVTFKAGKNYTGAAYLSSKGTPKLKVFTNTTAKPKHGNGRVIVRHLAAAPAVDIYVDGYRTFSNLTNPHQRSAQAPVGTYSVRVNLARSLTTVIGPANVPVAAHQDTIVYAWGSASGGTLAAAVQTVPTK